jgi:hypothetical protein
MSTASPSEVPLPGEQRVRCAGVLIEMAVNSCTNRVKLVGCCPPMDCDCLKHDRLMRKKWAASLVPGLVEASDLVT